MRHKVVWLEEPWVSERRLMVPRFICLFCRFSDRKLRSLWMLTPCRLYKNESVRLPNKRNLNPGVFGAKLLLVWSTFSRFLILEIRKNSWLTKRSLLRNNNIDLATRSKSALEHRQREEARVRKEANQKWETKVSTRRPSITFVL